MKWKSGWEIIKGAISDFFEDKALRLSAALAYYAIFSLAPLLILVISVAGLFLDRADVTGEIHLQIAALVGKDAADMVSGMLTAQSKESHGIMTIIGIAILLFGATGLFGQLQDALNTIWEVRPKPGGGIWGFIRTRFLSFAMILGIAFLLLISMVLSAVLQSLSGWLESAMPMSAALAKGLHIIVSLGVITVLFAMIFKLLPDATVKWRDVWVGAFGTALLFTLGKFAIGYYIARDSVSSAYGAAGSLVVILLWVYYSSLILFFGAEFTQVYALRSGSRIAPSDNAVAVSQEQRANEGLATGFRETKAPP